MTKLTTITNQYASGQISDLNTVNNDILKGLSDPSNTTNNLNCGTSFAEDSWIPSNSQVVTDVNYISCKVSNGKVGD